MSASDYANKYITPHNHLKLDEVLDSDNQNDRDLREIAECITDWEVKLVNPLGLTRAQVDDIKEERNIEVRRLALLLIT